MGGACVRGARRARGKVGAGAARAERAQAKPRARADMRARTHTPCSSPAHRPCARHAPEPNPMLATSPSTSPPAPARLNRIKVESNQDWHGKC
jgi:hypothetical protein